MQCPNCKSHFSRDDPPYLRCCMCGRQIGPHVEIAPVVSVEAAFEDIMQSRQGRKKVVAEPLPIPHGSIGYRMDQRRKALGVTWARVCELAGMSHSSIDRIKSGRATAHASNVVRIAAALKVDPYWLETGEHGRGKGA